MQETQMLRANNESSQEMFPIQDDWMLAAVRELEIALSSTNAKYTSTIKEWMQW